MLFGGVDSSIEDIRDAFDKDEKAGDIPVDFYNTYKDYPIEWHDITFSDNVQNKDAIHFIVLEEKKGNRND